MEVFEDIKQESTDKNVIEANEEIDETIVIPSVTPKEDKQEVFETEKLDNIQKILSGEVKKENIAEEDQEEDLEEIKQVIAEANIKKFKRNKNAVVKKKEKVKNYSIIENETKKTKKSGSKKFTRKKETVKKQENAQKKYTAKKLKKVEK